MSGKSPVSVNAMRPNENEPDVMSDDVNKKMGLNVDEDNSDGQQRGMTGGGLVVDVDDKHGDDVAARNGMEDDNRVFGRESSVYKIGEWYLLMKTRFRC